MFTFSLSYELFSHNHNQLHKNLAYQHTEGKGKVTLLPGTVEEVV
jgi:hypothetical protein